MVLNTKEALPRFANRQELYLQILDKVATDYGDAAARLQELVAKGQTEEARFLAHTLRGVVGNIGAQELFAVCSRLELALGEEPSGENPAEIVEEVAGAMQRLLACIAEGVRF